MSDQNILTPRFDLTHLRDLASRAPFDAAEAIQTPAMPAEAEPAAQSAEDYIDSLANAINEGYFLAARSVVERAFVVGVRLLEARLALSSSQNGKSSRQNNQHTEKAGQFQVFLANKCPRVPSATAYRWMDLAGRVCEAMGLTVPLNTQSPAVWEPIADFLSGKTMAEALAGVVLEGDDAHRITRAHNGKTKGGSGGDRKAYGEFAARAFGKITTFANAKNIPDAEKGKIVLAFEDESAKWPMWLIEGVNEASRKQLRNSK